jgi:hypothetical protein
MFALALALLALAADPKDPVKEAQDALQGEWRMVEFAAEGEANNRAGFVSIKSDQLVLCH